MSHWCLWQSAPSLLITLNFCNRINLLPENSWHNSNLPLACKPYPRHFWYFYTCSSHPNTCFPPFCPDKASSRRWFCRASRECLQKITRGSSNESIRSSIGSTYHRNARTRSMRSKQLTIRTSFSTRIYLQSFNERDTSKDKIQLKRQITLNSHESRDSVIGFSRWRVWIISKLRTFLSRVIVCLVDCIFFYFLNEAGMRICRHCSKLCINHFNVNDQQSSLR